MVQHFSGLRESLSRELKLDLGPDSFQGILVFNTGEKQPCFPDLWAQFPGVRTVLQPFLVV